MVSLEAPESIPRIQKLPEDVINRIAAGEVVVRPANALKELLENALDADSTRIAITVKDGGLKLLQISDNGIGIREEDLPILCERFTTSKLRSAADLSTIRSFGFRGEALASVSYVSTVTVTTCARGAMSNAESMCETESATVRTSNSKSNSSSDNSCIGFTCQYMNGSLLAPPKRCAATPGSSFVAENMFYNLPIRRQALKNTIQEYNRILEVVQNYAIHYPSISFICRKLGQTRPDIATPGRLIEETVGEGRCVSGSSDVNGNASTVKGVELSTDDIEMVTTLSQGGQEQQRKQQPSSGRGQTKLHVNWDKEGTLKMIQKMYGDSTVSVTDLQELSVMATSSSVSSSSAVFEIHGFVSSPNCSPRKSSLVLFINDRLVESNAIKRLIENLKNKILSKNAKYWIYLSLHVPPSSIDVNMHPTKKEVMLLHEEKILSRLVHELETSWRISTESKSFVMQKSSVDTKSLLQSVPLSDSSPLFSSTASTKTLTPLSSSSSSSSAVTPYQKVANTISPAQQQSSPLSTTVAYEWPPAPSPQIGEDDTHHQLFPVPDDSLKQQLRSSRVLLKFPEHQDVDSLILTQSSTGQKAATSVYRTRTDNRQTTLHNFIDLRRSKSLLTPETKQSVKKLKLSPFRVRVKPVAAEDVELDEDRTHASRGEAAAEKVDSRASFRSFLVPRVLTSTGEALRLRINPNEHPLESIAHMDDEEARERVKEYGESDVDELQSIAELKGQVENLGHPAMTQMVTNSSFIGAVDDRRALIQYNSNLIMIDISKTFKEAVYQSILYRFGSLPTVQFFPPVPLPTLMFNAVVDYGLSGYHPDRFKQTPEELSVTLINRILPFRGMLDEYFGIAIDKTGSNLSEFPLCCGRLGAVGDVFPSHLCSSFMDE